MKAAATVAQAAARHGDLASEGSVGSAVEADPAELARATAPDNPGNIGRTAETFADEVTGTSNPANGANSPTVEPTGTAGSGETAAQIEEPPAEGAAVSAPPSGPDPEPDAGPSRPAWLPIALSAGIVVTLFAIVAIVLILVGSDTKSTSKSGSKPVQLPPALVASQGAFTQRVGLPYFAMLPAGWSSVATRSLPGVVSAASVKSPIDQGAVLTIGQVQHPQATLPAEGKALMASDAKKSGFHQLSSGLTKLRDGTPAWSGSYNLGGLTTVDYVVQSCRTTLVASANLPPAEVALLHDKVDTVVSTLHKGC